MFITGKDRLKGYHREFRQWQGIPGVEKTKAGRMFFTFYSGQETEKAGNYVLLKMGDGGNASSSELIAVCDPGIPKRAFDPCLWMDPVGRLWWFWSQQETESFDAVGGVWFVRCDRPDAVELEWTAPRRFANGVMMNKPTAIGNGDWLFPCAIWANHAHGDWPNMAGGLTHERKSNVYLSRDRGETFSLYGQADIPNRSFDEHMILELKDGRLMMLVRTHGGIGKSYSSDGGKSWSPGEDSGFGGPCSRFFIRRLRSGRILLVNHHQFKGRNNLTAMVSEDDCDSWAGFLLLDERDSVSYPDGVQDDHGRIFIVYDRERGGIHENRPPSEAAREILMACVTEEDILAGELVDPASRLKIIVDKL